MASRRKSRSTIREIVAKRQQKAAGKFVAPSEHEAKVVMPNLQNVSDEDEADDNDDGDPFDETPEDLAEMRRQLPEVRVIDESEPKKRVQASKASPKTTPTAPPAGTTTRANEPASEQKKRTEPETGAEQEEEPAEKPGKQLYSLGQYDELRVHGSEIPSKYRQLFWETPAESVRRERRQSQSIEEEEAERNYRRQEAQLARSNTVGRQGWQRDAGEEQTRRQLRVGAMVERAMEQIAGLLAPVKGVWVGRVQMAPSMRKAVVYWHCSEKSEHLAEEKQKQINKLIPSIRHALAQKVRLKYVPELVFVHDVNRKSDLIEKTHRAVEEIEKIFKEGRL